MRSIISTKIQIPRGKEQKREITILYIVLRNKRPSHMKANPVKIIGHFGVNTWVLWASAVFTPTHNTPNISYIVDIHTD